MIKKSTKFAIIALIWTAVIVSWIDRGKTPDEKIFPIKLSEIREIFARKETEETKEKVKTQPRPALTKQTGAKPEERYKEPVRERPTGRQTEFNDDNYTPRELDNVVSAPLIGTYKEKRIKAPSKPQAPEILRRHTWKWESYKSGGGKKTNAGWFEYTVKNGLINTASVCRNIRFGSIEYRDCRKAAKKYFAEKCKSGNREACTGSEMIP